MTIITELLISECQSQNAICLNEVLNSAHQKSLTSAVALKIPIDFDNTDFKKLIFHNAVIELCEFKKKIPHNSLLYIDRDNYCQLHLKIIDNLIQRMELNKPEKSLNFYKNFLRYLKKHGFNYLVNVYLKQAANKMTLFR
jgi:hypothetical protein